MFKKKGVLDTETMMEEIHQFTLQSCNQFFQPEIFVNQSNFFFSLSLCMYTWRSHWRILTVRVSQLLFFFRHSLEHFKFWMFINDQFSDMIYTEHTVLVYISKTLCHKPLWQLKLHLTTRQHLCHWLAGSCYKLFVHNQHLYSACNLTAICAHIAPIEYILSKETRMYDKIFWFWGVQIWMMLMIFGESPPRLE